MSKIQELAKKSVAGMSKQEGNVAKLDSATILLLIKAAAAAIEWAIKAYKACNESAEGALKSIQSDSRLNRAKLGLAYRLQLTGDLRQYRSALVDATISAASKSTPAQFGAMFKEVK